MVECGIRLEEYQEGDLKLHRAMCMVRLMFRCSLCDENYVSKEGLWYHLDQHEIVDESKELHYQEIKAKHKFLQCVLCNDQRAYSKSSFWKHVHDVHDGFFLRCADCGEKFRSERLKNKHADGHCKARDRTVASDYDSLVKEQVPIEVENAEHLKLSRSSNANEGLDNRWTEHSRVNLNTANDVDNTIVDKVSELPTINSTNSKDLPSRFACDICGIRFYSKCILLRHKKKKYACMRSRQQKCQHCGRVFLLKEYQAHIRLCEKRQFPCELCPMKFPTSVRLLNHMKRIHRVCPTHIFERGRASAAISLSKTDNAEKGEQLLVEIPSSTSSDTKCVHCGKEFASSRQLLRHIRQYHKPTKCSICGITFESQSKLGYHKKKAHSKSGLKVTAENPSNAASCSKCSHCGIEESSAVTLALHILIHHDPVACDICGVTFSSLFQAQDHKKTTHRASKLECPLCSMRFATGVRLRAHVTHCKYKKVPCDFCGKMFKNVTAVTDHKKRNCRTYQRSNKRRQQNAETSLCDKAESSTVMDKISPSLVENGLSQTKCYYCYDEFISPGYLKHHLKACHELTKCDVCGITVLGLTVTKMHKKHCHLGPKYECSTCGKKFHHTHKYTEHRFECEQLKSGGSHSERHHPDDSSFETLELIQDRKLVQNNDLQMEITADDQGQSTVNSSSKIDVSNSGSNEHSLASLNDVSQGIDEESPMVSVAPLNGRSEKQVASEETSQPFIENLPNQPFSCSMCGITLQNYNQFYYHKIKKHTEAKFQCPYCSRKFHYKTLLERHVLKKCKLRRRMFNFLQIQTKRFHGRVQSNNMKTTIVDKRPNQSYTCNICGTTLFTHHQIRYHRLTKHGEGKFQCLHCSRKFHFKKILDEHASRCAGLKYSCELCGFKFHALRQLKEHKKQVHHGNTPLRNANIEYAEEQNYVENLVEKMDAAQEMTSCIICRITCANTDELMKHKVTCRKHTRNHDDSQFGAEEISLLDDAEEAQANPTTIVPQGENVEIKLEIKVEETMLQEQEYQDPNADPETSFASSLTTIVDKRPNQPYTCSICGITLFTRDQIRYHRLTTHGEGKFECPHCSRKFHYTRRLDEHVLRCAGLKHSCELCGHKFHIRRKLEEHKKQVHHGNTPSRNANIECAKEQNSVENLVEKMDAAQEMISCIICRITCANTDELMKHKCMDSQGIDEQSPMVSVARMNGSSEKQVVPEKTSQPIVENPPNQLFSCSICGITLFTRHQIRYHRLTRHGEGKFECPYCSRKFHEAWRFDKHASCCASLKHSCEWCGQKFHIRRKLEEHKKQVHHGNTPLRNANIECADEQNCVEHLVEKMDAAQEMISCIICRITCANTDELMNHKETCRKHTRKHDDSQFGAEEISLLDDAKEAQAYSTTIVPQGENVEIELEIKVEETVLQEQEYQDPNADPGSTFASSLKKCHLEAEYECSTCGRKFQHTQKYTEHRFECGQLKSGGSHSKRHHPDDSSFETPDIVQDRKQIQNNDLQMEIIAEERDDQGQSTVNPSSKVDVSNSLANLNDDELMDSQGIDEQSPMVSVAPLNSSSERQVVPEETSQPIVDKRPNQPYTCNICGITFFTRNKFRYHRRTRHGEGKFECPCCSRKFHEAWRFDKHASCCASLKHTCELCGQKFHTQRKLEEHKRQAHHGNTPSRNANIGCAEEQNSVENLSPHRALMPCGAIFYLLKEETCRKHTRKHDDSQFGAEEILLLDDVKEAQANSTTIVPQGENVEIKLEIKVEESMLQEQEYQEPNADPGSSFASSLTKCHLEAEYECSTCGRKFQHTQKYTEHRFECEQLKSGGSHSKRHHPDDSNFETPDIVQDRKQVQNNDLQMEITAEERDDQGQSTVNPSSKVDVSNSLATLNDDELMDSQGIDEQSPMVSVAPLKRSSERQVVPEETSQPIVDKRSNQPYTCNICGITFFTRNKFRYHRRTRHGEGKFECPYCSRKFHEAWRFDRHASCCASLKHTCELCGQKFHTQRKLEEHKKQVHHGNTPLRNANIECAEEQNSDENLVEKMDAAQEMTSCIICRITCANTDELMKHKETCRKHTRKHDDSQFGAEEISLLDDVKEAQANSTTIVPQGENVEIKLEIEVEETVLQEQEYQDPNAHPGCSFASSSTKCHLEAEYEFEQLKSGGSHSERLHPDDSSFKTPEIVQDRKQVQNNDLQMEITVEERDDQGQSTVNPSSKVDVSNSLANLNDDELVDSQGIDEQSPMVSVAPLNSSSERQVVPEETSQPIVDKRSNQPYTCNICGITFFTRNKFRYHRRTKHGEGKFECPYCSRKFHESWRFDRHTSCCASLKHSCELCGHKFHTQRKLEEHKKQVHHGNTPLRNANIECAEGQNSVENLVEKMDAAREMTSCIICRITCANTDELMKHKTKCHLEAEYECSTCGRKFHHTQKYTEHRFECEQLKSGGSHSKRHHPDDSSFETPEIVQDRKQVQNNDLQMEITAEERDDQGQSTVNPSSKVYVSNSLANLNDDELMDSQGINEQSPMVSVAPLNGSSERQVVQEETSQPIVENPPNQLFSCNICGITLLTPTKLRCHRRTKHGEGKFECPHCSRKFQESWRFDKHASCCASLKHSCEWCGQKFHGLRRLKEHKQQVHHGNKPLRNANIECAEEQNSVENLVEKMDADQDMTSCIICRITCASTDELMKHKVTCHKETNHSEKILQPTESKKKPSNQTFSCNICGITLQTYSRIRIHMVTKHTEAKLQCPHCSRKFHFKWKFEAHVSCCADLKHSCELCGQKFRHLSYVEIHKKQVHHRGSGSLRNANIEDADYTEEQNQHSPEKINAAQEMTRCRSMFATTDKLMKHKRPHGGKSKDVEAEEADDLANEIKIKEECLEDEEEILTEHQTTIESSECHGIPSDRNESLVHHETDDKFYPCSICGLSFEKRHKMKYHKVVCHTTKQHKCSFCQKMFHTATYLRIHQKNCSELRCNKCGIIFTKRRRQKYHHIKRVCSCGNLIM